MDELFQLHHFYAPFFLIKLRNEQLKETELHDVLQVVYSDTLDGMDTFDITVNNWNPTAKAAQYIGPGLEKDSPLFEPGIRVEIFMGYHQVHVPDSKESLHRRMLVGEIASLAVNLPASGQPTLRVSGQNILRKLQTTQQTHDYEGKKDSQIARQVFDRGNLPSDVVQQLDTTFADPKRETPRVFVKQDNQYDIVFMMSLARHSGYDLWLQEDRTGDRSKSVLCFGDPNHKAQPASLKMEWGKSLIQFQPTLTIVRQVGAVTVRGWNPEAKEPIVATAKLSDLDNRVLRDLAQQGRLEGSFSRRTEIQVNGPIHTKDEAKKRALAELTKLVQQTVTCSGTTLGFPSLRAGAEVELAGLGQTFSGRYILTATTHTIGANGYQTEFQARKEERK